MAQKRLSKLEAKKMFDKGYRKCVTCKKIKLLILFYKNKGRHGGYAYECKNCVNIRFKEYRKRDYVKKDESKRAKRYRIKNKKELLNKRYLKNYGITTERKMALLKQQNYCCKICGNKINMISGYIDHNHKTGKIRGILCGNCNTALGLLKDNIDIFKKAIKYLSF